jgi:glycosyltransferase involved in cell wall biosynthesis
VFLKIIYHHRTQADDAQGIHIYEMVNAFQSLGHQVQTVALVQKNAENDKKVKGNKWEKIADSVPNWIYELLELCYNIFGFFSLSAAVRASKPNFIYERYSLNTFCGIWIGKLFKIPLILEVNAPLYFEQKNLGKLFFQRLARFSERWVCSNADFTIVVSHILKNILVEAGVPEKKMVVMHNGVNAKRFSVCHNKNILERFNPNGHVIIGFVGWFRKWHGLQNLVEIFHNSNLAAHNTKLLLVGDGPSFHDLQEYVKKYSLEDSIILIGSVPKTDIPDYISAMDIAVQPHVTPYACPMKILEYMAMRKCIIAPRQANIEELLTDRENGLLFQVGNQHSLKETLITAISNFALRKSIGENAYAIIYKNRLFWEENAKRVCELVN